MTPKGKETRLEHGIRQHLRPGIGQFPVRIARKVLSVPEAVARPRLILSQRVEEDAPGKGTIRR